MNNVTKTTNKKNNEVATLDVNMFSADAANLSGFENFKSSEDLAIPFLRVLSQLSAQCNKTSNGYVEGAEPGMIYNTITKKLYDGEEGVEVIPCGYKREFVEWDANQQGKLIAVHGADFDLAQTSRDANYVLRMQSGNTIKETAQHYVTLLDSEGSSQALITMTGTAIKQSKAWNSMMAGIKLQGKDGMSFRPPMYSHIYTLKTAPQSNSKGTWFGWDITKKSIVKNAAHYEDAKAFAQAVGTNDVKVNHEGEEPQTPTNSAYSA